MVTSSSSSISTSALLTMQRQMTVISNNIANANTPGYSRQEAQVSTSPLGGVQVTGIKRMSDALANSRVLETTGESARLGQLSSSAASLDKVMSDSSTNIAGPFSDFFDKLSALSNDPSSTTARQSALEAGNVLSQRFNQLDRTLNSMSNDVNSVLKDGANQVNDLTQQIAQVNQQIVHDNSFTPELLDQRDQAIEKLVSLTGGNTAKQSDGSMNVYTSGGQALVIGNQPMKLTVQQDAYQSNRLSLAIQGHGQNTPLNDDSIGGKLGGSLQFRAKMIDPASAELGRLATAFAKGINDAQHAGVDQYGHMGSDLFQIASPQVKANQQNTGTTQLSAQVNDIQAIDGKNIELRYNGSAWTAQQADTGQQLQVTGTGTEDNPLNVSGLSLTVDGSASDHDRFLVMPTQGSAGSIKTQFTDAKQLAAALPVTGSASLDNKGKAAITNLNVTDPKQPDLRTTAQINFISSSQYTIDGGSPVQYQAGDTISAHGWNFQLTDNPTTGDNFTVQATKAGSSDNKNMLKMANIDSAALLDGGRTSLNTVVSGLTTQVASSAAQANSEYSSEQTLYNQATQARDSVSGVNLDQEAADFMKYQQAYQASAKVMSSLNTTFQSLLQAV